MDALVCHPPRPVVGAQPVVVDLVDDEEDEEVGKGDGDEAGNSSKANGSGSKVGKEPYIDLCERPSSVGDLLVLWVCAAEGGGGGRG